MLIKTVLEKSRAALAIARAKYASKVRRGQQEPADGLDVAQLEDRVLFSASPGTEALLGGVVDSADDALGDALDLLDEQMTDELALATEAELASFGPQEEDTPGLRHELVFVDVQSPDYQQLVEDLLAQSEDGREIEVVLLDAGSDGIQQISDVLSNQSDLDAVHIVSHAADGAVRLGDRWLDLENLGQDAQRIAAWRSALSADADLVLYGCDLAASEGGQQLIRSLAELSGADVAASVDSTGHAQLGGDWDLEFTAGVVETHVAFSAELQENWFGLLVAPAITARETVDNDANGKIDHIRITTNQALDDDFFGLTMTVAGYTLDATTPYITNIGLGGQNDSIFYIKLMEGGSDDTDATPLVALIANTTLSNSGGENISADGTNSFSTLILTGSDDVEERLTGASVGLVEVDSTDLDLGRDVPNNADSMTGLRFTGIDIPQGATITNAYIRLASNSGASAPANYTVRGEAIDNAAPFTSTNGDVTGRSPTAASQNWSPSDWVVDEQGPDTETPDLSAIVQEIVDRPGWNNNNAMVFTLSGTGARVAESFENAGSDDEKAHLFIEYVVGVAATDAAAPVLDALETADLDNDGWIDALHLTFSEAISDASVQASDFAVSLPLVTGLTFNPTAGGDTANDSDIYLTFNDGVHHSGITPSLAYTQSGSIDVEDLGAAPDKLANFAPTVTVDMAAPVLMSASSNRTNGSNLFLSSGDQLDLVFSETLSALPTEAQLESALAFAAGATDGDNLPDFGTGVNPFTLVTTNTANDTIRVALNNNNTSNIDPLLVGTDTVAVFDGTDLTDTAGNTANTTPAPVLITGAANAPPTAITPTSFAVDENTNTTGGFSLGTLSTTDADSPETFTYSIVGGADMAKFSIGGAGADELVLNDGVLDFETKSSYAVTVRVTDSGGNTYDETITVDVNDVLAPTITARETVDADRNGKIDHIRITTDQALDDDFLGLTMTVAGYALDPVLANRYVTSIGAGDAAFDNVFYVKLVEGASYDTGATPVVTVTANTTLSSLGGDNISAGGTTTLSIPIAASDDDAEERLNDGKMDLNSSNLDFGKDSGSGDEIVVGLRFQNITIPQGTTISGAYIRFQAFSSSSTAVTLKVSGQAADNAGTFNNLSGDITIRQPTSFSATWAPEAWSQDFLYDTASLSGVVQEIVNRPGWNSGNAMVFIFEHDSGAGYREADSWEQGGGTMAKLFIEYGGNSAVATDGAAPVVVGKETADLDNDGSIDALHVTFSEAISDASVQASDFTVSLPSVAGLAFNATAGGDTANDADIYLIFNDGVHHTGITPSLAYTQSGSTDVQDLAAVPNELADSVASVTADKAAPVLLSAYSNRNTGSNLFQSTGDQLNLVFSETLSSLPTEAQLEAAVRFGGGATDVDGGGNNLPSSGTGADPYTLVTTNSTNDTIQVTFNANNTVAPNLLLVGTHTARVTVGTNLLDVAANTANTVPVAVPITGAVNMGPTITNLAGDALAYSEGAGPLVMEQGNNATVTDVDSADFNTGNLTVSIVAGGDAAEDVLSIRNQGMGAGQIGLSGNMVYYGGVQIGTAAGGSGGANLVVTFNASATPTAATALVKNITYQNTDTANPTAGVRTVRFTVNDGDGATSAAHDATVTVSRVNEAPTAITPTSYAVNENTNTTGGYSLGTLSATDEDSPETFTYSIVGGADAPKFSIGGAGSNQLILADGVLDFETKSSYTVIVRVTDSALNTHDETVTVTVNDVLAPTITARETVDADGDGKIDHIRITTDQALDDDFSGLTVLVTGYALDSTTPYITNIGAGGANDNVVYVKLVEGASFDTGVTPMVILTGNTTLSNLAGENISAGGTTLFSTRILASADDAEQEIGGAQNGSMDLGSTNLDMPYDQSQQQAIGLRFQNVTIAQGAPITNAYVRFTANSSDSQAVTLAIHGQAADDPGQFSGTDFNITNRTPTDASVTWNPSAWIDNNQYDTPNLSPVVQEIVSRPGWGSGNDMVLIVEHVSGSGVRVADSWDRSGSDEAWLFIQYGGNGALATDDAAPVLLSASSNRANGTNLFQFSGAQLDLVFSETLSAVPGEAQLEAALAFAAGATDGDNLPGTGSGVNPFSLVTTNATDDTIRVTLNTGNTLNTNLLLVGTHTVGVIDGTNLTDTAGNTANNAPAPVLITGVANTAPAIMARQTVDADADGKIDHIRITTDQALDDQFSGLSINVAGYTLDAATPYVTNIGAGGINDNVFYVKLVEGATYDTGATPVVTVAANTTLSEFGGTANIAIEAATLEVRVSAGNNDAEESVTGGSVSTNSSDLELVEDGGQVQQIGMRFLNLAIPQGAAITNAYIEFTAETPQSDPTSLNFYGERADNPAAFTTGTNNITNRLKTVATVPWNNIPEWTTDSEKHQTPDLSSVIQEIVNQGGWSSGNAMVIIVTGTGKREAYSYDGNASKAALLHIEYSSGGVAATDGAAPVLLAKETADLDNDGSIDALHLSFSEAISDASVEASDFTVSLPSVTGLAFNSTAGGDTANDADIYLTFDDGVHHTGITPSLAYTQSGSFDVQDLASAPNTLANFSASVTVDKAAPVLLSASSNRTDGSNLFQFEGDRLDLVFSETIGSLPTEAILESALRFMGGATDNDNLPSTGGGVDPFILATTNFTNDTIQVMLNTGNTFNTNQLVVGTHTVRVETSTSNIFDMTGNSAYGPTPDRLITGAVNTPPTITNLAGDNLAYTEDAGALLIDQGNNATVTDVDSQDFNAGNLTVSIVSGGDGAEDVLSVRNQGSGAGQIGFSAGNVYYGGVLIGNATGGSGGANLAITLNASATPTAVTALVRNITYRNTDTTNPTEGTRTVRFTVSDGDGATSAAYDATVTVTRADDPIGVISDINAGANSVAESAIIGSLAGITARAIDPDVGDTVTYSLDNDAGGRFAIDANTGVVTVAAALDAETATSHNITVRATSSGGTFSGTIFNISVSDVNEAPVGPISDSNPTADSVAENAGVGTAVGITALADDPDLSATVTYSLDDDAGGRFAIDANTGVISLAALLDAETATSHSVTVRATSSDGSSTTQAFSITVTDVNEAPVGPITDTDASANSVAENASIGTAVGITALATDPDISAAVTYSLDDDAGGRFAIDANTGVISVAAALDAETATSHIVTVRATSSDGSFTTQAFSITVTDVNEAPVGPISDADGSANRVAENAPIGTAVGITAMASDPDISDTVTYSLDDDAGGLFAIDANTGVVSVAGTLDAETATSHNVTVRATSSDGSFTTQAFSISLTDVNEAPLGPISDADGSANSVAEDAPIGTAVGITALATDADISDTVTYSLDDDAGGLFAIDANTGVVSVAGTLDAETATSHNVTVRATSSDGSFTTQAFSISVTDVNEAPVGPISDSDASADSVAENGGVGTTVGIAAVATDSDVSDTVTYSLDDDAGGLFAIDLNTGVVSVAGILDAETATSHNITVRATSSDGSFTTQVFSISVTDANEAPIGPISDSDASADSVVENAGVGTAVGITTLATDPDISDTVNYTLDDNAGGLFAIDSNTGLITVAGALDFENASSHAVTVRATSTDGSATTRVFTISVIDVNEAPTAITPTSFAVDENTNTTGGFSVGSLSTTDPDSPESFTYTIVGGADAAKFSIGGVGSDELVLDDGTLDFEAKSSYAVVVRVTDSAGNTHDETIIVNVNDLNDVPVAITPTSFAVDENINTTGGHSLGSLSTTDPDSSDSFTYSIVGGADAARFSIGGAGADELVLDDGTLDYEAKSSYSVVVRVSDSGGNTHDETITVNVNDLNEAPTVITPTSFVVDENTNTTGGYSVGSLSTTDPDSPESFTYSIVGGPDAAKFSIGGVGSDELVLDDGTLDFEAQSSYAVVVRVTDSGGNTHDETITVNVNDLNEAPTAITPTSFAVDENTNTTGGYSVGSLSAADPDSTDSFTYSVVGGADAAKFSIGGAGSDELVLDDGTLNFEAQSSYSVIVRVTDSGGLAFQDTLTINVIDANDMAPVITPGQSFTVNENAGIGTPIGTVVATDADTVGSLQNWTIAGGNVGGVFQIDPSTGQISLVNNSNLNYASTSTYTLAITVSDGVNSSPQENVTIAVNDVNFSPVAVNDSYSVAADGQLAVPASGVLANDSDRDGDPLAAVLVGVPANGTLDFRADGSFVYTPLAGFFGQDQFRYMVNDAGATSQVATATITVRPTVALPPEPVVVVVDAPVAIDVPLAVAVEESLPKTTDVSSTEPVALGTAPPQIGSFRPLGRGELENLVLPELVNPTIVTAGHAPEDFASTETGNNEGSFYATVFRLGRAPLAQTSWGSGPNGVSMAEMSISPPIDIAYFSDLESVTEMMTAEIGLGGLAAGALGTITLSLSAGYAFFTIRAGYLVSSLLATIPAWKLIDPLPVLTYLDDNRRRRGDGQGEETLESLVRSGEQSGASGDTGARDGSNPPEGHHQVNTVS